MKPIEFALIVTVAVGSQGLLAQSLGEVAREAERRKPETPSRVITGKDLGPAGPASPAQAPAASPASRDAGTNTPPEPKYVARDASYWLGRMRELQTKRDYLKLQAEALEKRVNELQDGDESRAFRRRGSERERLRTEHALALADLAAVDKQIADLEDEARRSNVPPGWLRP